MYILNFIRYLNADVSLICNDQYLSLYYKIAIPFITLWSLFLPLVFLYFLYNINGNIF